jgi:hypothetical protein
MAGAEAGPGTLRELQKISGTVTSCCWRAAEMAALIA